jgi:creatinine amidohydrolase/Fe(II)-dependent formamide hydrolase-like protein
MQWTGTLTKGAAIVAIALSASAAAAAKPAALEQLTTVELKERLQTGCPVALLYNGGVEESGPHLALGKHNLRIYQYGAALAQAIGDAILLPVMPFSPNDAARMAFAGTISLRPETWVAVNEDVARSLIGGGFQRVAILTDHGDGMPRLREMVERLDKEYRPKGARVFFVEDAYTKARTQIEAEIKASGKVPGGHGGLWDTAEAMAADPNLVRPELLAPGTLTDDGNGPIDANGISGDPRGATVAMGRRFAAIRVKLAADQLRGQLAAAGACH